MPCFVYFVIFRLLLLMGHQGCEEAHGETTSASPQVWGQSPWLVGQEADVHMAEPCYGGLIWHQYTANSETWWLYLALYQQCRHHRRQWQVTADHQLSHSETLHHHFNSIQYSYIYNASVVVSQRTESVSFLAHKVAQCPSNCSSMYRWCTAVSATFKYDEPKVENVTRGWQSLKYDL